MPHKFETQMLVTPTSFDSVKSGRQEASQDFNVFPRNENYSWSMENFGPVKVPAKAMRIKINAENFIFYREVLHKFEGVTVSESDGRYYFNGREIFEYTFQQNYYFMLGDNRGDSKDSRYWGFLPEANILGKASYILFSTRGFDWRRIVTPLK